MEFRALKQCYRKTSLYTGYLVDRLKSFSITNRHSNSVLLKFSEAIAVKRLTVNLCVQKETVTNLSLP